VLAQAVRYAEQHDTVLVAAAGNQAQQGNPPQYPAAYPGVIAVGAIGPDGKTTQFSQSGTGVSVVAPGSDIIGPGAGGTGLVAGEQGTSFAAPFVAGVAALVRAYRPQLTAGQVKHRIEATADHPAMRSLPDPGNGFGVVNPYRAVTAELPEELASGPVQVPAELPAAPAPRRPDTGPSDRAAALTTGLAATAALTIVGAVLVPVGRRRRWRPAGSNT
jgi:subtilisin family serine protease